MIYDDFIEDIIKSRGQWYKFNSYYEKHHIIPRSIGGSDDKSNIIHLTAKEHFLAHKFLTEKYPNEYWVLFTFQVMSHKITYGSRGYFNKSENSKIIDENEYEKIKSKAAEKLWPLMWYTDGINEIRAIECPSGFWRGRKDSVIEAIKNQYHPSMAGEKNGMWGKHLSEEEKNQRSILNKDFRWFNNDIEEAFLKECPEGWKKGRLKSSLVMNTTNYSSRYKNIVYINDGKVNKRIKIWELDNYISLGWNRGKLKTVNENISQKLKGRKWIHKGDISKTVPVSDVDRYLKDGWIYGRVK